MLDRALCPPSTAHRFVAPASAAPGWVAPVLIAIVLFGWTDARASDAFDGFLKPLFAEHCVHCHGEAKTKGKIHLEGLRSVDDLRAKPELIEEIIGVIDASDMPPEDEPELGNAKRAKLLEILRAELREAAAFSEVPRVAPMRRLNRFQYASCVTDLFELRSDVFRLPEKLMTRHSDYLRPQSGDEPGEMPDRVDVSCRSLEEAGGWPGVNAFPKDLRAAHGFDNQANQLTLSPLLLDAFVRLSVSIVESPEFREENVGIWSEFFAAPRALADLELGDLETEVARRLGPFLRKAFRGPVDPGTLERYVAYARSKIVQTGSFTDGMKKAASAILTSPLFLYRFHPSSEGDGSSDAFGLASDLSFFFWGSGPDDELLRLAESGELRDPGVLASTVDRMLEDPKIERFLDTFPAQWMQLENVLAATPDAGRFRLFSLEKNRPASVQMVLEPLLLFDAIFVENRPIVEFLAPSFSYRSEFLEAWYQSKLEPEPLDREAFTSENRMRTERLRELEAARDAARKALGSVESSLPGRVRKALETIDLTDGHAKWLAEQERLVAESVVFSTWHRIGPFGAASFDEAHDKEFIDPAAIDLERAVGDRRWVEAPTFVDGKVHSLTGANSATYLHRTVEAGSARTLEASLGSDDSFKIWVNGKLVAGEKVSRGVAPDQNRIQLELRDGRNSLVFKISNGGGGHGFYFKAQPSTLPGPILTALRVVADERSDEQRDALRDYYRSIAPEFAPVREAHAGDVAEQRDALGRAEAALRDAPKPQSLEELQREAQRRFDDAIRGQLRSRSFQRVAVSDPRYGGVITNAAMLSMTSGPKRTHPIARGAWVIEVVFNDPPPPPPNDVPPLNEDSGPENLTIRERFAQHRENPDCAGCHSRLDPLGFALENYDVVGRWRDRYDNGREVDSSGTLLRKYEYGGAVAFKDALVQEERRFAKAFTAHLLRFGLARELGPRDALTVEAIVDATAGEQHRLRSILREVVLSESFRGNP